MVPLAVNVLVVAVLVREGAAVTLGTVPLGTVLETLRVGVGVGVGVKAGAGAGVEVGVEATPAPLLVGVNGDDVGGNGTRVVVERGVMKSR